MKASKIGFMLLGVSAFIVFAFKVVMHFDKSPGIDAYLNEFIVLLPFVFAVAAVLILNKLGMIMDLVVFIVTLAVSYFFIVPVYLGSL